MSRPRGDRQRKRFVGPRERDGGLGGGGEFSWPRERQTGTDTDRLRGSQIGKEIRSAQRRGDIPIAQRERERESGYSRQTETDKVTMQPMSLIKPQHVMKNASRS